MPRIRFCLVFFVLAIGISYGQSGSPPASPPGGTPASALPCAQGNTVGLGCAPTRKEVRKAKSSFATGLKLQHTQRMQEAYQAFDRATHLVPQNAEYLRARELVRQQLVFDDLHRGNAALSQGNQIEAMADFQNALLLDPQNDFAQQRVRDVTAPPAMPAPASAIRVQYAGVPTVEPNKLRASFHFRGNGKDLLTQIGRAFGIAVAFDESVVSRPVQFDVDDADFYGVMLAASEVTHTFWTALQSKQILIALESAENHRKFDRMAMRSFYVPGATTPTDLSAMVTLLRNIFDIRMITSEPQASMITIRAPEDVLEAATQVLEGLSSESPEVMLDVRVYEIDHMLMRNMGIQIPNQFQLFNIPAAALLALGGQNAQNLINQLIASGGINQANTQGISALLAQLQGQGQQSSIFSQPVATFGNGTTLMALSLGTLSAQLSLNESWVKNLENFSLRASQEADTTVRMGSRYPVLNASFAPIYNSSAIAQVIQNNSFQAPFPSVNYEDLGVTLKAKPTIHQNGTVSLHLEMQLRTLVGQSINGVPVIANREFQGSMVLENGEPAVLAGAITHSETRSMTGIPGLGLLPGLNQALTTNSKQLEDDELLIVLTPRVVSRDTHASSTEVWLTH